MKRVVISFGILFCSAWLYVPTARGSEPEHFCGKIKLFKCKTSYYCEMVQWNVSNVSIELQRQMDDADHSSESATQYFQLIYNRYRVEIRLRLLRYLDGYPGGGSKIWGDFIIEDRGNIVANQSLSTMEVNDFSNLRQVILPRLRTADQIHEAQFELSHGYCLR